MRQRQEARQSLLLLLILLSRWQHVESKLYRAVTRQLSLSSFTGSGRYAVMARRAVQLEEGLVHIMAVSGVGNTPMARATNSCTPVKYWEIIADKLSRAGWRWGWSSAVG